jgi:glycosyltransferase involved in cell wall biosynthesis
MEKLYGCDVLVDAFITSAKTDDRLCLLMLGDGTQKDMLMRKIAYAGFSERVKFVGFIPETRITAYFQACDIYVSASHTDGSSVSLLQAMACGIPPLVSDIPGNREWVTPGQNGWLFDDGDRIGLSGLMTTVSSSPQLRTRYGSNSRHIVEEKADWAKNSRKLEDAYEQAIKIHHGRAKDL